MLKSQVFEVLLVFISVVNGLVFKDDLIHHFMDDQELQYYFGTISKFHVPHYEVVKVAASKKPLSENQSEDILHLNLRAFDDDVFLKLKINKNLVSPFMRFVEKSNEGEKELDGRSKECHYIHIDDESTAAISGCDNKDIVRISDNFYIVMIYIQNIFRTALYYDLRSPSK